MPTTPNGIRYPALSAPPNVPYDLQLLAEDIDPALDDTGWIDFDGSASFTRVRARYCVIGKLVLIECEFTGAFPAGATVVCPADTFPPGVAPDTIKFGSAYMAGGYPATAYVATNGSLAVAHRADTTRSGFQCNIDYRAPEP